MILFNIIQYYLILFNFIQLVFYLFMGGLGGRAEFDEKRIQVKCFWLALWWEGWFKVPGSGHRGFSPRREPSTFEF